MATAFVSWRDVTYEVVDSAGLGGVAKVSKVVATSGMRRGTHFAVKVFSPDSPTKESWKSDFMREVHVLRDCDHPAIVKVFDEGVKDGRPFFVMEYLPHTLWDAMRAGRLDELAKLSIIMQLLSALHYLSCRDPYVVHRDIKPKNIFLKADACVLGDFGLIFQDVEHGLDASPEPSVPAMAQMYRTPELVAFHNGGPKPPPKSDVFQLGLVAAELFTGNNPLRHAGPGKPVALDPLGDVSGFPGAFGASVKSQIEGMLVIETERRLKASQVLSRWLELYLTLIKRKNARQRAADLGAG